MLYELSTGEKVGGREYIERFTASFKGRVMDKIIADYVDKFSSFSDSISETIGSVNEYWIPDESPLIMLFSQIGKSLVAIFLNLIVLKKSYCLNILKMGWLQIMMN